MLMISGTVPFDDTKVVAGPAELADDEIVVDGRGFPVNRGTAALIATVCVVCRYAGLENPFCVIAGDIGKGDGSTALYTYLKKAIPEASPDVVAFHYFMPDWYHHDEVFQSIQKMKNKPLLVADAGFMYVAKLSGFAPAYSVFTPDLGELAYLADGEAPHPFYTRGFIFHKEEDVEGLIRMAYEEQNAARYLMVKGTVDYVCEDGNILHRVSEPDVPVLEAIGGTGDTITGMIAALIHQGHAIPEALRIAATANRVAGRLANPNPATQIAEIIEKIPVALDEVMKGDV